MKKLIVIFGLLLSSNASSNSHDVPSTSYWNDVKSSHGLQKRLSKDSGGGFPVTRNLYLDERLLKDALFGNNALTSSRPIKGESKRLEIELPLPDGNFIRVRAIESPILSAEIAEQYPEIKTWKVVGVDNPRITGRLDFTSKGFHGMLNMPDGDTVYIDPDKDDTTKIYHSLSKLTNSALFQQDFDCNVHDEHSLLDDFKAKKLSNKKLSQIPTPDLITYRLVVAGTAEYTNSQGGKPTSAFSSMITTINRVNDIYQRDLGVKLEIVSGNQFAYTSSSTDPYTNNNARSMVMENIENINSNFGASNYDIGHVFAQGPLGGLSYVGAACQDGYKAGGVTGIPNPQGEIFSIQFVSHEIGHQLGATHTFNSEQKGCGKSNRSAETAVESGSGSTIMSYTGLCGTDNLQRDSDALFHWASIDQINNYTRAKKGNSCGARTSTGTQNPVADAGVDSIIPIETPFFLKGSETRGKYYSWEQVDAGQASPVDVDSGDNAIIRAMPLSSSKDRYVPRLSDLFSGSKTIGEILPQTVRSLNFAFVVRDGSTGVDSDVKTIQIRDAGGSFQVLSQTTDQTFSTRQTIDIAWSVAGTNVDPINCSKVDIQLLQENAVKNMLLSNVDNDGEQRLVIPALVPAMNDARIMVSCRSQPFFQISKGSITIESTGSSGSDEQAPVIILLGNSEITLSLGQDFIDPGYTVSDNRDTHINVDVTGLVDVNKAGTYILSYKSQDTAGNIAIEKRTVIVLKDSNSKHSESGSSSGGSFGMLFLFVLLIGLRGSQVVKSNMVKALIADSNRIKRAK